VGQARIGGDRVAGLEQQDVTGDNRATFDDELRADADDARCVGGQLAERCGSGRASGRRRPLVDGRCLARQAVMIRICIAVADAARARLYTFEQLADPTGAAQELRECVDLVDPERRRRPSELFSDTRPGSDRTPSGRGYGLDDHRDAHVDQFDLRFAAEIVARLTDLVREHGCRRVIVAASPRMLGHLRRAGASLFGGELAIDEIDRDLTKLSSARIHDLLADKGLLPARSRTAQPRP
jgi:protein required for attachment to host cells